MAVSSSRFNQMGKTYLLTGGAGFLGQRIVETLCSKNVDDVTTLKVLDLHFTDEQREEQKRTCREANITIEWIEADITDYNKVLSAVSGSDVVIHTASVIAVQDKIPFKTRWNINVGGTINLLKACSEANVRYFIYTSTISVVGPNRAGDPFISGDEETDYISDSTDPYPVTKREAEKNVLEANGTKTADGNMMVTCVLRPSTIYGARCLFLRLNLRRFVKKKFYAVSKPTDYGSSIYVGNATWCHISAAQKIQIKPELIGGNIYFLGDNTPPKSRCRFLLELCEHRGFSISEPEPILSRRSLMIVAAIISIISDILVKIGITYFQPYFRELPRPFIIQETCANFTVSHAKFKRHFDYVPLYSWEEARDRTRKYVDLLLDKRDKTND